MLADDIKKLSKSEKLLLINDLWDDIADSTDDIPLNRRTEMLLDERYAAYKTNPNEGRSWEEVKKKLRDNA